MSAVMVSMTVLIRTFSSGTHTHTPCFLKLCIPPSNGIVRCWLFPEFGAELPLDNCTPTIILNNLVFDVQYEYSAVHYECEIFLKHLVISEGILTKETYQLPS